ncbi:hypothetical protein [Nocardioides sp. GXZ039]|uniref:hypothetical protein n=1 Tax=Nocardioides sp. GXZ039 TaxID=3136018 RepID=UPI0030F3F7A5
MAELEDALTAARSAYAAATRALALAEAAADAAEVSVAPMVVDELTVKRINVVEDDGSLRIVIGNSTHGKTMPLRGELIEHPGRHPSAGILFVNDEGTECGGLQFAGTRGTDAAQQTGYLAFDDFEQNESFRLGLYQEGGASQKFLEFADQPAWSIADLVAETDGQDEEGRRQVHDRYFGDADGRGRSRMRLARENDGSVRLVLRDAHGRDRLRFIVPADGDAVVEVVDHEGTSHSIL